MFFRTNKEMVKYVMDEMMKVINRYPNGTRLKVEWENGKLVLCGKIDTIYESNNGLDDDVEYKEFYACAFWIEEIVKNSINKDCNINSLIEISTENQPTLIMLYNGDIIWKRCD